MTHAQPVPGIDYVPDRILVRTKASVADAAFERRLRKDGRSFSRMRHSRVRATQVPREQLQEVLTRLRNDPEVEYAELDGIARTAYLPNDPMVTAGQTWHLEKIGAARAWDFTSGTPEMIVAVLDTGIAAFHPDLEGRILPGIDLVNDDADPSDDYGHGTAVAGVIVASANNNQGTAGVAFGASVLPVKVADASGFAAYSDIAEGILYAVDQGARVINISIAGTLPSATLQEAIDTARSRGVVVVAASGNNGNTTPLYPASCVGVISVGATTTQDLKASFSNYGSTLQLTAPGDGIWTTQNNMERLYASWRGTSFSTPVVSGVAALALTLNPAMGPNDVEELLRLSSDDLGAPGWDPQFGWGRVNAARMTAILLDVPIAPNPLEQTPELPAADTEAPRLGITAGPRHRARTLDPLAVFSGLTRDEAGPCRVEVLVNGQTLQAEGSTNWNISVPLEPGTNWITFRAWDMAGNPSRELRRAVFRVVETPLQIDYAGGGRVSPDLNGALLEIGRAYTVRAVADPGQMFASWGEGQPLASTPVLRFIMEPGLVLKPVFVTNLYPTIKGTYTGLVARPEGVTPESSGYFVISLNGSGRFSGALLQAGQRSAFSGAFLADGTARCLIRRRGLPALNASFVVDLGGSGNIAGKLTDGAWVAEASGSRNSYAARSNPAPQAGARNFLLNTSDNVELAPAATGLGRIARSGSTLVNGGLCDGRRFVTRSALNNAGDYPLFLSFNKGTEVMIGWLNFPVDTSIGATGQVLWVGTGTNSFAMALRVTGN